MEISRPPPTNAASALAAPVVEPALLGRIEAMYDADQTLGERGIAVKARGVVSEPGARRDENQR